MKWDFTSLVGCRVIIFQPADYYYLEKLPPGGKYSWRKGKQCQKADSIFSAAKNFDDFGGCNVSTGNLMSFKYSRTLYQSS